MRVAPKGEAMQRLALADDMPYIIRDIIVYAYDNTQIILINTSFK